MIRLLPLVPALFGLMACASKPADTPAFEVRVSGEGDKCVFEVNGKPVDPKALGEVAHSALPKYGKATVRSSSTAPYRCIGGAISILQSAGHIRVRFMADGT